MRYLVKSKVKPGQETELLKAIETGTLGRGSVAGEEYLDDMQKARIDANGVCTWVEVCFCDTPLQEERPYWEQYFDLIRSKMHMRARTVAMPMAPSLGPAATVIAPENWKNV